MPINIVGVDCATDPKNVGYAFGSFQDGRTVVEKAALGSAEMPPTQAIADWLAQKSGPTMLTMDAPLGWPAPMSQQLPNHNAGEALTESHAPLTSDLSFWKSSVNYCKNRSGWPGNRHSRECVQSRFIPSQPWWRTGLKALDIRLPMDRRRESAWRRPLVPRSRLMSRFRPWRASQMHWMP